MKLRDLLEAVGLNEVLLDQVESQAVPAIDLKQNVVIETAKQLLPNASYEFEVEERDGRIILSPTVLRH